MSNPVGAQRYGLGGGDAYYDAVKYGGYTGTREQFGRDQAEFAQNATAVAQAKEEVERNTQTVVNTAQTFTEETVPAAIQSVEEKGDTEEDRLEAKTTELVQSINTAGAVQVQAVEDEGTEQIRLVSGAGTAQVEAVEQAGSDQVDAIEQAGSTQVENVNDAGTTQVGNVNQAGTTQVGNVNTAGVAQVQAVQAKGTEVINSIPADYTELSEEVDRDVLFGGYISTYLGVSGIENVQVSARANVYQELFRIDVKAGIPYAVSVQLSETPSASVYCYLLDENHNFIESNGSIFAIADTIVHSISKTFTNDHKNVIFAVKTTSGCKIQSASITFRDHVKNELQYANNPFAIFKQILNDSDIQKKQGDHYGPVHNVYVAQTTTENWQQKSYVQINDIPVNNNKYCYAIIGARHGLGLRAGTLSWYNSMESGAERTGYANITTELYDAGPCIYKSIIPEGTVKINAQFEGISNASSAGTPSVIGEEYYVKDCYVYLTNEPFEISAEGSLDGDWKSTIDTIREEQGTSFCFGIQTDTHYAFDGSEYVGLQLKQATKYVGFDFIANLGDITRGYTGDNYPDTPENMRLSAKTIMKRYTDGVQCPFFVAVGNHEKNTLYANAHEGVSPFTQAELYAQFIKQTINTSVRIVNEPGKNYYYADLNSVRVIVLDTNDSANGLFTVSEAQIEWFESVALNTTKPVLILAHVPLISGLSTNYSSDYANIVTLLEEFKDGGGQVIACIYGHTHNQQSTKQNGIWHITCTKSDSAAPTTAEFFMVDQTTFDITTIGIGTAQSRTFTH